MGNALRDQLLKAGLVNDKQVKQAAKEKRKENSQKQGQAGTIDETRLQAQKAQAEKVERDRQLNWQRQQAAEQKAMAAQIRQLIEANREPSDEGDIPYHFVDGNKVKRLFVSERVRDQLSHGRLAIVRLDNQYELVSAEIARKIGARDGTSVVLFNDLQRPTTTNDSGEDPYADYPIPDDLMW